MNNNDTVELLKETNSGIKMGVSSLCEVLQKVKDKELKSILEECKSKHENLGDKTHEILNEYGETGKDPNPIAKGMSFIKTNVMLSLEDKEKDKTIADIVTDGCNMGVKSLRKYLNQYESAEEKVKDICKDLIKLEEDLIIDIKKFL